MLTLRAAQRICAEEGFDEALDTTRDRVDQIEGESSKSTAGLVFDSAEVDHIYLQTLMLLLGLHRQSELTVKEPFRIVYGERDGKKVLDVMGLGESFVPAEEDEEEKRLV